MDEAKIEQWVAQLFKLGSAFIVVALICFLSYYMWEVFNAYMSPSHSQSAFKTSISGNIPLNVGIPCAAAGAFGIVGLLLHAFPPEKQDGAIKVKFVGVEFTGPAGPVTLWIASFLSIVAAISLLK